MIPNTVPDRTPAITTTITAPAQGATTTKPPTPVSTAGGVPGFSLIDLQADLDAKVAAHSIDLSQLADAERKLISAGQMITGYYHFARGGYPGLPDPGSSITGGQITTSRQYLTHAWAGHAIPNPDMGDWVPRQTPQPPGSAIELYFQRLATETENGVGGTVLVNAATLEVFRGFDLITGLYVGTPS